MHVRFSPERGCTRTPSEYLLENLSAREEEAKHPLPPGVPLLDILDGIFSKSAVPEPSTTSRPNSRIIAIRLW